MKSHREYNTDHLISLQNTWKAWMLKFMQVPSSQTIQPGRASGASMKMTVFLGCSACRGSRASSILTQRNSIPSIRLTSGTPWWQRASMESEWLLLQKVFCRLVSRSATLYEVCPDIQGSWPAGAESMWECWRSLKKKKTIQLKPVNAEHKDVTLYNFAFHSNVII